MTNKPNPGDEIEWVIRGTVLEDSKPALALGFFISSPGDGGSGTCTRYVPYSGDWRVTKKAERFKTDVLYKYGSAWVFRYTGDGYNFECVLSKDSIYTVGHRYSFFSCNALEEIEL